MRRRWQAVASGLSWSGKRRSVAVAELVKKMAAKHSARVSRMKSPGRGRKKARAKLGPAGPASIAPGKIRRRAGKAAPASESPADGGQEIRRLKTELAEARARIEDLQRRADTDYLLDIPNRRGFERGLRRSIDFMTRYQATGAVIVLDVDRLKPINDAYGHGAGDAVLKAITGILLAHVRSSDLVGRLGGDEFGVLLWNLEEAAALAKAAALEQAVDGLSFSFRDGTISAGASTGVTMLEPSDRAAEAIGRADRAMYARKRARTAAAALKQ